MRNRLPDISLSLLSERSPTPIDGLLTCEALSITKDYDNILGFEHFKPVEDVQVSTMNWKHPRDETAAMAKQDEANSGTRWSFIAALLIGA